MLQHENAAHGGTAARKVNGHPRRPYINTPTMHTVMYLCIVLALCLIASLATLMVIMRWNMFWTTHSVVHGQQSQARLKAAACDSEDAQQITRNKFDQEGCNNARAEIADGPYAQAWRQVYQNTHMCIDVPCHQYFAHWIDASWATWIGFIVSCVGMVYKLISWAVQPKIEKIFYDRRSDKLRALARDGNADAAAELQTLQQEETRRAEERTQQEAAQHARKEAERWDGLLDDDPAVAKKNN